jgi:surface antigen
MANLNVLKRLGNSTIYAKIASLGSLSLLLTSSALTICVSFSSVASADTLSYPWPTDTEAPCKFAPQGGASCTNPNDSTDKYDWGVNSGGTFHPYRSGYEYRNCTDYTQWKESTVSVSVPGTWGNGGQWYGNAPAGEQSTTPKAWDAAVVVGNPGHVAFVESVSTDGSQITISEYNHDTQGHGDTRTGTPSSMGITKYVDFGVHPGGGGGGGGTNHTPIVVSFVDPSGLYQVFTGTSSGVYETDWGPGVSLNTGLINNLNATSLAAYVDPSGLYQVFTGTANGVYETDWGNGLALNTGTIASGLNATSLAAYVDPSGLYQVFTGTANGVYETDWGPGVSLNTGAINNKNATSLASFVDPSGLYQVFTGTASGVYETDWGPGVALNTGTIASGLNATSLAAYVDPSHLYQVFTGTSSGVYETDWGPGVALNTGLINNKH